MKLGRSTILHLISKLPNTLGTVSWVTIISVCTNILSLVIPVFFMQVYDRIIPNNSEYTLIILTVSSVIIILLDTFFIIGRGIIASWSASKFAQSEGSKLMQKLYGLSNRQYYSKPVAEYNDYFKSVDKLKRIYAGQLFQSMLDIPFIIIFLFGIYYISGRLVLFHISILLLFCIFSIIYHFLFTKYKLQMGDDNNKRLDVINQILNKIHPLKSQGFEEMLLRKLEIVQAKYSMSYFILKNKSNIPTTVGDFFAQIMIYGTIVIGGIFVFNGSLSLGIVSAATMLARRTVGPLISISRLTLSLSEAKMDLQKIEVPEFKNKIQATKLEIPGSIDGLLEIKDVSLKQEKTVFGNLENINLVLDKGYITGILSNDSGAASKLVDVILGIQKPDRGQVLLDSVILTDFEGIVKLPEISIIPRRAELFTGTILENITLFKPKLTVQALDTASFLDLDHLVSKLPKGYETEVSTYSTKILPTSLINRISIARALVTRPRVIISNQADNAMNEESKKMFIEVLKKLCINTSVLIISDNHHFLDNVDKLYMLDDSKLFKLEEDQHEV